MTSTLLVLAALGWQVPKFQEVMSQTEAGFGAMAKFGPTRVGENLSLTMTVKALMKIAFITQIQIQV